MIVTNVACIDLIDLTCLDTWSLSFSDLLQGTTTRSEYYSYLTKSDVIDITIFSVLRSSIPRTPGRSMDDQPQRTVKDI
jgi:hypothetical protein